MAPAKPTKVVVEVDEADRARVERALYPRDRHLSLKVSSKDWERWNAFADEHDQSLTDLIEQIMNSAVPRPRLAR